eukprot:TRINITY_DN20800_c0_g1_i1.p2 TRINITY_DN20800_c0_g1~~TRINITY_DN20800_c0_g1_i1.p2  ORF type:complete len:153 (+),score=20.88 TRINITY_DN20800_c0_g1_i1:53-460(+)
MGQTESTPRRYGDPLTKAAFDEAASRLMSEHRQLYLDIDRCVNDTTEVNKPVSLRCQKELNSWNEQVFRALCPRLYHQTAKCQKDAGENWHRGCAEVMNELMQCGDEHMRRLHQYNLEHSHSTRTVPSREDSGKR